MLELGGLHHVERALCKSRLLFRDGFHRSKADFDERDVKEAQQIVTSMKISQNVFGRARIQSASDSNVVTLNHGERLSVVRTRRSLAVTRNRLSIYHPHEQFPIGTMFLVVRSSTENSTLTSSITKQIQAIDPELPAFEFRTMEQRLSDSLARRRFLNLSAWHIRSGCVDFGGDWNLWLDGPFSVTQRTQEIGIRMALGAQPGKIMMMVVRQSDPGAGWSSDWTRRCVRFDAGDVELAPASVRLRTR